EAGLGIRRRRGLLRAAKRRRGPQAQVSALDRAPFPEPSPSSMRFDFATAGSIRFGAGAAKTIPSLLPDGASPIFLVTGAAPYRHKALLDLLQSNGYELALYSARGEPTLSTVSEATEAARAAGARLVLAIGGGSVIDTGKAVAALAPNPGDALEYLE